MTLFKQIAIMLSIFLVVILTTVLTLNFKSANKSVQERLYEDAKNTASSLSLSLGSANGDISMMSTMINANFDSGNYLIIALVDVDDVLLYERTAESEFSEVPTWFLENVSIEAPIASANVSAGWSQVGILNVQSDVAFAYTQLYTILINLLISFGIITLIALVLLYVILAAVLKPLHKVQLQAEAILNNEFVIQKKVPFTTEFKDVVKGMNAMVSKVEEIFKKGNEAAQRNKELLYNDPVTKLFNRRYLMLKLPDLIKAENKTNGGTIIFVALSGAEIINQDLGRQKADQLFLELAKTFLNVSKQYDDKVISRVNGTEFTLMLPDCDSDIASDITRRINRHFSKLIEINELNEKKVFIDMGIYKYSPHIGIGDLLTRADSALSHAKSKDNDNTHLYEEKDDESTMGKEQWRAILEDSITKDHFSLKFWPTVNAKTKTLEHKVMTFTIDGGENKKFFYGDFIAPAINLGLVSKIYLVALKDLVSSPHKELEGSICSIRLSNEFIKDKDSFTQLSSLFEEYARTLSFKLSFEVSDSFAINNTHSVKNFVDLFAKYNFTFGINSFTGESSDFTYLKDLNPTFIKADTAFLLDQSQDSMASLQVITDSLGIEIVASFVKTLEELKVLQKMHINSVQGPVTDFLK